MFQHAGEERAAWHAGAVNERSIGIELQIERVHGVSCNSLIGGTLTRLAAKHGVSTESLIREACTPTAAQYESLALLIEDIRSRHQVDRGEIVGHCEVVGPGGHADPRAFDWSRIGLSNADKQTAVAARKTACSWYHLQSDADATAEHGVL